MKTHEVLESCAWSVRSFLYDGHVCPVSLSLLASEIVIIMLASCLCSLEACLFALVAVAACSSGRVLHRHCLVVLLLLVVVLLVVCGGGWFLLLRLWDIVWD